MQYATPIHPHVANAVLFRLSKMEEEDDILLAVTGLLLIKKEIITNTRRRRRRRTWAKKWLLARNTFSHTNLIKELDPDDFRNYLRMDEDTYAYLLLLVTDRLEKKNTVMRTSISPHERLTATLRFVATGRAYKDLKYSVGISQPALTSIIPETCGAIYDVLQDEYMKFPKNEEEWIKIAKTFDNKWQFPHCLGAVDGKHVQITRPKCSGSYYYNYKQTFSLVLVAIVDANHKFTMVDFGTNGRVSDGGVIEYTHFYHKLQNGLLYVPAPEQCDNQQLNYVFVGDEAFALRTDFLKPFNVRDLTSERRVYNYRLSRCRRVVENAFGILASRFRIFHTCINMKLANIDAVVMACCALHNLLITRCSLYTAPESMDFEDAERGVFRPRARTDNTNMLNLETGLCRNPTIQAKKVRDEFVKYFNNEGRVPWQDKFV